MDGVRPGRRAEVYGGTDHLYRCARLGHRRERERRKDVYKRQEHDGCTNLLFMMDGIELDTGRLVLWRLRTHAQFGGTWLSDYLPNRLGVEETVWDGKPDCPLIGANGNIFNLMGIAARTLAENDRNDEAKEMCGRVIPVSYTHLNSSARICSGTSAME